SSDLPHCRMVASGSGRGSGVGGCPTIRAGSISSAGVEKAAEVISAPDDHVAAGPHSRVKLSSSRRAGDAGSCPTVSAGIISTASVKKVIAPTVISAAPDDHFAAGPHCRVEHSTGRRVGSAGGYPTVGAGIVSPAGHQIVDTGFSTPDDHFAVGPHCRVIISASGRAGGAGG